MSNRFDDLSRSMAQPTSRRGALKVLLGAAAAATGVAILKPLRGGALTCPAGAAVCGQGCCAAGAACTDPASSCCCPKGTTPCGRACCNRGVGCIDRAQSLCGCPAGTTPCGAGTSLTCCPAGQACAPGCRSASSFGTASSCVSATTTTSTSTTTTTLPPCSPSSPCATGCCSAGTCASGTSATVCGSSGTCVDCSANAAGHACVNRACGCNTLNDCPDPLHQQCSAAVCVTGTCNGGGLYCRGVCYDSSLDKNNCGSCGTTCTGATPFCNRGTCAAGPPNLQRQYCTTDADCTGGGTGRCVASSANTPGTKVCACSADSGCPTSAQYRCVAGFCTFED